MVDAAPPDDHPEYIEVDYVHIAEVVDSNGQLVILVNNSESLTPWKMLGMLEAARQYQATVNVNLFYGFDPTDDNNPDDPDEPIVL